MLPIAGQTGGPIGLKFFVNIHGWPGGGGYRLKKSNFFSHGHWPMPDPSASIFFFLFYRSHSPVQGMKQNLRKINIISYFKEILELNRKINN